MTQALLITLREGLEISLLVVIVLAYLREARRGDLFRSVWYGVGLAAACSVVVGAVLFGVGTGLSGKAEEVFEGSAMFVAAAVLTWMIIWMKGQARHMRRDIELRVERAMARGSGIALASLAFVIVIREGLETALFLFSASKTATPAATTIGGLLGLFIALAIGKALYQGSRGINLKTFFNVTGVLLVFFAAGLLAHGIHEFQEAGYLTVLGGQAWDMNGVLSERGTAGSLLKGILGYNGNPSVLEVVVYPIYLIATLAFFLKPASVAAPPRPTKGATVTG